MAAISQTTFSNAFSWMNFDYDLTEFCSWGPKQEFPNTGSDNGLAPARRLAIIWTNDG